MTLSDRERLIAHWFVTMQSLTLASIMSGANIRDMMPVVNEELEQYRVTNCPRISREMSLQIYDDIHKFNKSFDALLDFKQKDSSKSFGV